MLNQIVSQNDDGNSQDELIQTHLDYNDEKYLIFYVLVYSNLLSACLVVLTLLFECPVSLLLLDPWMI